MSATVGRVRGVLFFVLHPRRLLALVAGLTGAVLYVWYAAVRAVPGGGRGKAGRGGVLVLVVSVLAASQLTDLLTNRFTLPGTDTRRAEVILEEHFGQSTDGTFTVVVESDGQAQKLLRPGRAAGGSGGG